MLVLEDARNRRSAGSAAVLVQCWTVSAQAMRPTWELDQSRQPAAIRAFFLPSALCQPSRAFRLSLQHLAQHVHARLGTIDSARCYFLPRLAGRSRLSRGIGRRCIPKDPAMLLSMSRPPARLCWPIDSRSNGPSLEYVNECVTFHCRSLIHPLSTSANVVFTALRPGFQPEHPSVSLPFRAPYANLTPHLSTSSTLKLLVAVSFPSLSISLCTCSCGRPSIGIADNLLIPI